MINKEKVYRSSFGLNYYKKILRSLNVKNIKAYGIYPVPMISHSIEFPFSLMPKNSEKNFLKEFNKFLQNNKHKYSNWLCEEDEGQAIILWGTK